MEIPSKYITTTTRTPIVCKENHRVACFVNTKQNVIQKIQVDGGVIPCGSTACDNLVRHIAKEPHAEYFVELKGTDVKHAISQLEASIKLLSESKVSIRYAIVVSTNSHPAIRTDIQRGKKHLLTQYDFTLVVKSRKYEHNLDKELG